MYWVSEEWPHDDGLRQLWFEMLATVTDATADVIRSARRQTVRQTCSCAAAGVPPGITNERSGSSVALTSSHACSSHRV